MCDDKDFMVGQVNPENPFVLDLLKDIYKDVLDLNTNTEIFHLGNDEVDLNCWSQFRASTMTITIGVDTSTKC